MALSRDFLLSFSSSLLKPNRTIRRKIFYFNLTNDNFGYKKINDTNNTNNINKNYSKSHHHHKSNLYNSLSISSLNVRSINN